jgi:hypothetical protein
MWDWSDFAKAVIGAGFGTAIVQIAVPLVRDRYHRKRQASYMAIRLAVTWRGSRGARGGAQDAAVTRGKQLCSAFAKCRENFSDRVRSVHPSRLIPAEVGDALRLHSGGRTGDFCRRRNFFAHDGFALRRRQAPFSPSPMAIMPQEARLVDRI